MKYRSMILCSSIISASMLYSQTDNPAQGLNAHHRETVAIHVDELTSLRNQVTQQTIQIKGILDTLCDSVKISTLPAKETICRELALLREFIQNMVEELPIMSYKNLRHLIKINNQLLEQLKEQLSSGDLCGLCNLDASLFTTIEHPTRQLSPEELLADRNHINKVITEVGSEVSYVNEQINAVWNLVSSISLAHYTQTATTTSNSAWDFINHHKGYVAGAATLAGAYYLFRDLSAEKLVGGIVKRIPTYGLVALYLLRQQTDKDAVEIANNWFGEDASLAHSMITLKKWVGSPKEKKPAVHIVARYDMTLEEQQRWADDNDCVVIKTEKGRDCDFMQNFVEFEDGLFKLPLAVLFSCQAKADLEALSKRMDGLTQYIISCLLNRKAPYVQ